MAHSKYTGYSGGTAITFDGDSIPTGWKKITIAEKGRPLPTPLDTTVAGDAAYQFTDDPLGGKTNPSCTISVEGNLSVTDFQDSGISSIAVDTAADLIVTLQAAGDEFTATDAVFKGMNVGAQYAGIVPYRASFELPVTTGVWATAA